MQANRHRVRRRMLIRLAEVSCARLICLGMHMANDCANGRNHCVLQIATNSFD